MKKLLSPLLFSNLRKILLALFLGFTNLSYSQWFSQTSGVTTDLLSVFFLDSNYIFIVGSLGTFIKTTDGGINWVPSVLNPTEEFRDVYFFNRNEGIIVGTNGLILRTTDGGNIWNTVPSGVIGVLYSVSFYGANGVICGSGETILYSTNNGESWNISQTGFNGGFADVFMLNSNIVFITGLGSIFQPYFGKSTNGGITWEFHYLYFNGSEGWGDDIHFFDENNGLVVGVLNNEGGFISKTTNGGIDWSSQLYQNDLYGIDFPNNDIGYVTGLGGTILFTTDSGLSWSPQLSGISNFLADVDFFGDDLNGVAVGGEGLIIRTNNGGVPVELTSFTFNITGAAVNLHWITVTEVNNIGFEIEKRLEVSSQESEWERIGFVEGKGTTTQEQFYSFVDKNLSAGKYSYRLKQIDFDGTFEYSNIVEVEINLPSEFSLSQNYPNPFNPSTKIKYTIPNVETHRDASLLVTLKIYDVLGNEVATLVNEEKSAGIYEITFDASGLASGIYYYKLVSGKFIQTKKMLLLK